MPTDFRRLPFLNRRHRMLATEVALCHRFIQTLQKTDTSRVRTIRTAPISVLVLGSLRILWVYGVLWFDTLRLMPEYKADK